MAALGIFVPQNHLLQIQQGSVKFILMFLTFRFTHDRIIEESIDTNIISSTSTCTYIDIDNISTYIDIEINVWSIPKSTCMFVCVWL